MSGPLAENNTPDAYLSDDAEVYDAGTVSRSRLVPVGRWFGRQTAQSAPPAEHSDILAPPLERPIIKLIDSQLPQTVKQVGEILSADIFAQVNVPVRVGAAPELKDQELEIDREPDQRSLIRVTPEYIQVQLAVRASIQRCKKNNEWVEVGCPRDLANIFMRQGDFPQLRQLVAIARAPFLRSDGTICDTAGYDPISRVYYIPSADFGKLPETVDLDGAKAALETLAEPFCQFPYASQASRAGFVAHILTEAARLAIDFSPMFWYTAPDSRTGKTMLSEFAASIVQGVRPARRPWVDDADEQRKTLFASLLAGDRSIAFDNLPNSHKFRAPTLCAFLTADVWKDRLLGKSETPTAYNLSVVSASGNNVTPASDLAPRSIVVRLDANATREEMRARTFKIPDLRHYVTEHRTELLMAALTILRAHSQSKHKGPTPLPGFEKWSRLVRDAVLWLDMEDPVETQKGETDEETSNIDDAFRLLAAQFGTKEFTARDVSNLVGGVLDVNGTITAALQDAGCSESSNPVKVGYWLRDMRDKIGSGYKLVLANLTNKNKWRLKPAREVRLLEKLPAAPVYGNDDLR